MEGAFKMSGLRRWCLIASISLRHVCHRHGSEPIPENQCPLEPLRRLDRVAGKPSKCYSVLTAQNPQCKVRNTSQNCDLFSISWHNPAGLSGQILLPGAASLPL